MKISIFYVGDTASGQQTLRRIASQEKFELIGIAGRSPTDMAAAKRYSTSYLNAGELNTDASLGQLRSTVPDILLNFNSTVLFGEDVLAIPRLGAVNFHPGPLPGYAGLHPNQWAILHGETEFGVTLHRMDMGIDTGDILLCSRFPIQQEDTGLTLFIKALREGQNLLDQLLDQLLTTNPKLEGTPQDLEDRGYFSTPLPNNGVLDFGWSAHAAANFIRALSYRPMTSPTVAPTILCKGTTIELSAPIEIVENEYHDTSGRLLEINEHDMLVGCSTGSLRLSKLYVEGQQFSPLQLAQLLKLAKWDILQ